MNYLHAEKKFNLGQFLMVNAVLFNSTFTFFPISTALLVTIFLLFWFFSSQERNFRIDLKIFMIFLVAPYVLLISLYSGDTKTFGRIFYLFFNSFLPAFLLSQYIKDTNMAMKYIIYGIAIQALFIFVSFFSIETRQILGIIFQTSANYDVLNIYRGIGFTSQSGSTLSILMATGMIALLYLIKKRAISTFLFLIIAGFIFLGTLFTGRTGTIVVVVLTLICFLQSGSKISIPQTLLFAALSISFFFLGSDYFFANIPYYFSVDYFVYWISGIFTNQGTDVFQQLVSNWPPITQETFFGTGLTALIDGQNPSGSDNGYVQTYYANGVIITIMFYVLYQYTIYKSLKPISPLIAFIISIIFLALEFKEPFSFKGILFVPLMIYFTDFYIEKNAEQ